MKKIIILLILSTSLCILSSCTSSKPEPTTAPSVKGSNTTYILNKNSKKFHYPSCASVDDMLPKNKWEFTGTRQEVINKGYKPCGRCNP